MIWRADKGEALERRKERRKSHSLSPSLSSITAEISSEQLCLLIRINIYKHQKGQTPKGSRRQSKESWGIDDHQYPLS